MCCPCYGQSRGVRATPFRHRRLLLRLLLLPCCYLRPRGCAFCLATASRKVCSARCCLFFCYLSPNLLYDRLLALLLDALPQTQHALMRSCGNTTHQHRRHARVAALRAILRRRALLLPGREFSARFSFRAVAARPVVAHLGCACSTTPSLCISRLPRCCAKVGLRLRETASEKR